MTSHLRPRSALLTLRLDATADPCGSDLALSTRAGEVVWRGEACPDAWQAGLRLRARWQGQWSDALWAMTVAVLDAELALHGLRREKHPPVDVTTEATPDGTVLAVRCPIIPQLAGFPEVSGPARRSHAVGV